MQAGVGVAISKAAHLRAACKSWMMAMEAVTVDACMKTNASCSSPCSHPSQAVSQ